MRPAARLRICAPRSNRCSPHMSTPATSWTRSTASAARPSSKATSEVEPSRGRVGPYRLLRELGRGGMGVVYLAERAEGGFAQRVVIKLIKRGMDSDAILRRFLRERQILAGLEHVNVARLLDGGVTDDGQPYFAMEYVDGEPLTTYCDGRELTVEQRLRLFEDACRAVQHAHGQARRPSRPQALQHAGHRRGPAQAARLRHRQAAGRGRRRARTHSGRRACPDPELRGAGAGAGGAGDDGDRRLRPRRRPL